MNIVLFGASGFIGRRVAQILRAHGHTLRTPSHREFDYLQPNEAAAREILRGTDAVFNCIGVMSRHENVLETVHHRTPSLLAKIAAEQGVRHWMQLSALGADPKHAVHFVGSKGRGDEAVCQIGTAHGMSVAVARPSIVYGRGGASCELFIKLARLPVIALPAGGRFMLQPVHANDVVDGLVRLLENGAPHGTIFHRQPAHQSGGLSCRHADGAAPQTALARVADSVGAGEAVSAADQRVEQRHGQHRQLCAAGRRLVRRLHRVCRTAGARAFGRGGILGDGIVCRIAIGAPKVMETAA